MVGVGFGVGVVGVVSMSDQLGAGAIISKYAVFFLTVTIRCLLAFCGDLDFF